MHPRLRHIAALTFTAVAVMRLERYAIVDRSMLPTLADGDWVVALKIAGPSRVGDVVIAEHPRRRGMMLVKRVAAVAGTTRPGSEQPVPDGHVWLAGDNPAAGSVDSASLGPVAVGLVRSRVLFRYHPHLRLIRRDQPTARA